jgi:hypothetical protein
MMTSHMEAALLPSCPSSPLMLQPELHTNFINGVAIRAASLFAISNQPTWLHASSTIFYAISRSFGAIYAASARLLRPSLHISTLPFPRLCEIKRAQRVRHRNGSR